MIQGTISPNRQPVVRFVVRGPQGKEQVVDALLDTGFNGSLSLPIDTAVLLGLVERKEPAKVFLANGQRYDVPTYSARLVWEGIERPVRVLAMGDQPSVGMALFVGYKVCLNVVDGGSVTVNTLDL